MTALSTPSDQTRAIIRTVAHMFDTPFKLLMSPSAAKRVAEARAVCIGVLIHADGANWSLLKLGELFGRDHTTVMHARMRYRRWCDALGLGWEAPDVASRAEEIARHLGYEPLPLARPYMRGRQQLASGEGDDAPASIDIASAEPVPKPSVPVLPHSLPADERLARFVQIYLLAAPGGAVDMPALGAFYRTYSHARGERPLPLAQFGAELLRMVRADGGRRCGPRLIGLRLRRPDALVLRAPPRVSLLPESTIPDRWLGVNGRPPRGATVMIEDDGSVLRTAWGGG